jgi:spore maturation protein CgeB
VVRLLLFDTTAYEPSSPLFLEAAEELAQSRSGQFSYMMCDEAPFAKTRRWLIPRIARRIMRRPPVNCGELNHEFLARARAFRPDVVLVGKGAFLAPATLARVKRETGALLVNYATDDPFNSRVSTQDLIDAIPLYNLYACTKRAIMADVVRAGCANAIYVPFAYKPSVHYPEPPATLEEHRRFDSDVVFIGGCDNDRIPFFTELLRKMPRLNLKLYGGFWSRHPSLRRYWCGFAMGREYRMALGGAKIALNLVRRANRDGHVMRSFEIPACGAFMLAERTPEHLELFGQNDAAYFTSLEELAARVDYYLARDQEREAIARRGRLRVTSEAHSYLDRLLALLNAADSLRSSGSEMKTSWSSVESLSATHPLSQR